MSKFTWECTNEIRDNRKRFVKLKVFSDEKKIHELESGEFDCRWSAEMERQRIEKAIYQDIANGNLKGF